MKTEKKKLSRISIVVTAQTKGNLDGCLDEKTEI